MTLQYLSLGLEVLIVLLGLRIAATGRRWLGAGLALSFTLYLLYNFIKQFNWPVPPLAQEGIFFAATFSIFLIVVHLARPRA